MKNQMQNEVEHDMETGSMRWLDRDWGFRRIRGCHFGND